MIQFRLRDCILVTGSEVQGHGLGELFTGNPDLRSVRNTQLPNAFTPNIWNLILTAI